MAKTEVSSAKENRKSKPEVSFAFKLFESQCNKIGKLFVQLLKNGGAKNERKY